MKIKLIIITCLVCFVSQAQIKLQNLRCELLVNPLGIDVLQPRLSWEITSSKRNTMQQAYQIIVSSSLEKLKNDNGDLWNSNKMNSDKSIQIKYNGKLLTSGQACFWKIKTWTTNGTSDWSEQASWTMGLLKPTDWQAKWIGLDKGSSWDSITQFSRLSARYFRKEFQSSNNIKNATVHIIGLGLYELFINGKKVGDQVLAPAPTDYRKSVLCNTYNVTEYIKNGNNAIATVLGNGRFFTMRQNYKPKKINTFGYPKMLLQLEVEYKDGSKKTIVTDNTWKLMVDGPIRSNNEYDGEEYDATKELTDWNKTGYNDGSWQKAELVESPGGTIVSQMQEPMKIMRIIKPISITPRDSGRYILDMGQNMVGWLQLKVKGSKNDIVVLKFAESLKPDGSLYIANLRDAKVTDHYTLKGGAEETWHPTFVFHGFRYVEVQGFPGTPMLSDFEGQMVYDDLQTTGSFETSNKTVNQIYKNAWWGIAGNYKGMPIDCPQRNERQPWLGDRAIGALGESFLFDNSKLYAKWLDDIEQSQTAEGVIPDVAPAFWNYYTDDVTWPATYITIADMLYKQFGDLHSIESHYPSMKKWIEHMQKAYMKEYLIGKDKYGDWCVPPESLELIHAKDSSRNTDGTLIATGYYYQLLQHMSKFAKLLNKPQDAKVYDALSGNIKTAFNQKFYNKEKGYYGNNTVTSNLLPLYFGIVSSDIKDKVFQNITKRIIEKDGGHISTGLIGSQYLMRGLSNNERPDIAFKLASNTTYPSWGYMVENGATTIWELWNGNTANPQMNSQNHVMLLGDLLTWMYENMAGIQSDDTEIGFKKIIMHPMPVDGLSFVNASYQSVHGLIKSEWKNNSEKFEWNITVPSNTKALIYLPTISPNKILENGKYLTELNAFKFIKNEGGNSIYEIGSGNYFFTVNK